jgi:hypothetical protein
VDVVELKTNHLAFEEAGRVELQRDLRLALSEYAPGCEVVAAERIWVSGGLNKPSTRDWQEWYYPVCSSRRRFHYRQAELPAACPNCIRRWVGPGRAVLPPG